MEALPQEDEIWGDLYAVHKAAMRDGGRWPTWTPRLVQYATAPGRKVLVEGDGAQAARYLQRFVERGLLVRAGSEWVGYNLSTPFVDALYEKFADKIRARALAKLTPRERKALGLETT